MAPSTSAKGGWLAPEPRVKGVAFRTIEQCFLELCGARAHQKATELMAPAVVEAYRYGTLLPAGWYPISWYREVFRAYRAAAGMGPELPRRIGSLAARHDMKGAHKRLMVWLISPQALLKLSQRVFSTYYDTGRLEVVATRNGFARIQALDCVGWDTNMWCELVGSCESLLEIAGARHVRIHVVSGGREGDVHQQFEAHWAL